MTLASQEVLCFMGRLLCSHNKGKGKVGPVHVMKAHIGRRGIALPILNLRSSWTWFVNFTPWPLYPPVIMNRRLGGPPEQTWTFWRRYKFLVSAGIRTPDRPARKPSPNTNNSPGSMVVTWHDTLIRPSLCLWEWGGVGFGQWIMCMSTYLLTGRQQFLVQNFS
jgi:hypothetical protein